jgi:hypothetical protein
MKMKKFLSVLFVVIALFATTNQAQASGLQFGVKAGLTVNDLKFNSDVFNADNRCGYTVGLMTKFTAPVLNLGFDASVMFTHRSTAVSATDETGEYESDTFNRNYIEIPINLRWDISLPVVGSYVTPFVTTGPDFSFQVSDDTAADDLKEHKFDFAWNVGFGLMFVNKVQVHASYGFGLSKATSTDDSLYSKIGDSNGKNRFWTISAAYLF